MNKFLLTLFCFCIIAGNVYSQPLPAEGSSLNYRIVGFAPFSTGNVPAAYKIQIASGNYHSADSFHAHILKTVSCKGGRNIIEVPEFGCAYTWRTVTMQGNAVINSELRHFTTTYASRTDTTQVRLRVTTKAQKYKDGYAFIDGCSVLYDVNGKPVWHLPKQFDGPMGYIRDMKMTPAGTVTFIAGDKAYEIDYDGNILWQAPNNGAVSGTKTEFYHHEFSRLSNGNYMILGNEPYGIPLYNSDNTIKHDSLGNAKTINFLFGTVIEYDKQGNVVWSWKSSKYYRESDLVNYYKASTTSGVNDVHENAFYFDEKNKEIYVSFKGISRVLRIKYPEGNVISTYGEIFQPGLTAINGNGLFCGQHACKYSQVGCLFLFNNNGCTKKGMPKVKQFKEMNDAQHTLKKTWEYECSVDDGLSMEFPSGGGAVELPDHSLFVCMGSEYSKVFIVNMNKMLLWSAIPEHWDAAKSKWLPVPGYRAFMITDHKAMEKLVWGAKE